VAPYRGSVAEALSRSRSVLRLVASVADMREREAPLARSAAEGFLAS
jgi:hypothetical protein